MTVSICLGNLDEAQQCFFQKHLALAMHLYLFEMRSETPRLSLPCPWVCGMRGDIRLKSEPPWDVQSTTADQSELLICIHEKNFPQGKDTT